MVSRLNPQPKLLVHNRSCGCRLKSLRLSSVQKGRKEANGTCANTSITGNCHPVQSLSLSFSLFLSLSLSLSLSLCCCCYCCCDIYRGVSSSKGLIGGLSSIVQEKKDNRKERKTKRKKKKKNRKEKTRGKTEGGQIKTDVQEEGKKDAPVQDWKLKTSRKRICIVERVKKRPEGRNTATLRYGRGQKSVPETDRKTEKGWQMSTRRCKWKPKWVRRSKDYFCSGFNSCRKKLR